MFRYAICNVVDRDIFIKQCLALENNIPSLKKLELLRDVDDSETQIYELDGHEISVHNSYYIGVVYVDSEIELRHYFA